MNKIIFLLILSSFSLFGSSLDTLLEEYEEVSNNSLQTIDEKLGHILVYSQKEIKLMQYNKLSDILKELPHINLSKNRYGLTTPSIAGTKTTVSGFYKLFINEHEVNSVYTDSFAATWGEMPLDFVDHIEVYYGESSFALGNSTGIYFIRVYTKDAKKENAGKFKSIITDNSSNSNSLTYSENFENGWSYLLFLNKSKTEDDNNTYKNIKIPNDDERDYLFLDVKNETTNINIGYSSVKKDVYMGMSSDVVPDNSDFKTKDFFININKYLLDDKSLKFGISFNKNDRFYKENNKEGISYVPVYDYPNSSIEIEEDIKLTKINALISKEFTTNNNKFIAAFNFTNKNYDKNNNKYVQKAFGSNVITEVNNQAYNSFNEETIYSLLFENDYKVNDNLYLLANVKVDKYDRNDYLKDENEKLFKIGTIYTPFENIGLKTFYTKTYLPPSFYNVDFASKSNKDIKTQEYDIYTAEGVYTTQNSKFGITYHNVEMEDFIYSSNNKFVPGFINIDNKIKTSGFSLKYEYIFSNKQRIKLNYFFSKSSEKANSPDKGGYFKYMGSYDRFEYFTSMIYRNSYDYKPTGSNSVFVKDSYNFSLGTTYNYSKNLTFSIKGNNLFDNSTKTLYYDGTTNTNFALKDYARSFDFSLKWIF